MSKSFRPLEIIESILTSGHEIAMPTGLIEMIMKQPFLGEEKHDKL
jgi:hypothetical protein